MVSTKNRLWLPLGLFVIFLSSASCFETAFQPVGLERGYLVTAASAGNDAALARAAGEFRIVAANMLWSKVVDHYHHQFMAQQGDWSKNESLLPLLQTIIDLDPHFVQAYEIMGSEILPKTGHLAHARSILALGIKNNPNNWELYREMAMLYAWRDRNPAQALPYARTGLAMADDKFSRHLMTLLCHTLEEQIVHPNLRAPLAVVSS